MGKPKLNCEVRSYKVYDARKRCRWKRVKGLKLELLVIEALRRMGLLEQFRWCPNGRVDFIWDCYNWEFELKNLEKTEYVTIPWLFSEVVSRFSDDAERKVLVVTKSCWNAVADVFLEMKGIDVIEVGSIRRKRFYESNSFS